MYSSGTTAIGTSGAGYTTLVTLPTSGASYNFTNVINEGTVAGFVSVDGGNTWVRLSASSQANIPQRSSSNVLIKRDGTSDMTGVYGFCSDVDRL